MCTVCHRWFTQKHVFTEHVDKYTRNGHYTCNVCICRKHSTTECVLHNHMKVQQGQHRCEQCGKWFRKRDKLKRHVQIHSMDRPFQCLICGSKRFRRLEHLKRHIRVHIGIKPYLCHLCDRRFARKEHLSRHSHRGQHKCEKCGKCFVYAGRLKRHRCSHLEEKYT